MDYSQMDIDKAKTCIETAKTLASQLTEVFPKNNDLFKNLIVAAYGIAATVGTTVDKAELCKKDNMTELNSTIDELWKE